MTLPTCETLLLNQEGHALHVTLNRPKARNAMSLTMVNELMAVFESLKDQPEIRAVVLRGAEKSFCSGGDIKDMGAIHAAAASGESDNDPYFEFNRTFGRMITYVNQAPVVVVAVLEGAVLGGGFGLACISDVAIASKDAVFGLPETSLGIPPAQIAPFVVNRIGLTQARRLALLGLRVKGDVAKDLGIVHEVAEDDADLEAKLEQTLKQIKKSAPKANIVTKKIILSVGNKELETLLDDAAKDFSAAVQGEEGAEGTLAFIEKRKAQWAQ